MLIQSFKKSGKLHCVKIISLILSLNPKFQKCFLHYYRKFCLHCHCVLWVRKLHLCTFYNYHRVTGDQIDNGPKCRARMTSKLKILVSYTWCVCGKSVEFRLNVRKNDKMSFRWCDDKLFFWWRLLWDRNSDSPIHCRITDSKSGVIDSLPEVFWFSLHSTHKSNWKAILTHFYECWYGKRKTVRIRIVTKPVLVYDMKSSTKVPMHLWTVHKVWTFW